MAEQEESLSVHEHIEPNVLNIATILAVVIVARPVVRWLGNKWPNVFGGLSTS